MAIDRWCVVVCAASGPPGAIRARSRELAGPVVVAASGRDDPRRVEPSWGRFVAGAVRVLAARGASFPGADLGISSSVPAGSGLSSSSALAVALTLALADLGGLPLESLDAAHLALAAEVEATGVPGGLMDQLAALFGRAGHALLIDCRTNSITTGADRSATSRSSSSIADSPARWPTARTRRGGPNAKRSRGGSGSTPCATRRSNRSPTTRARVTSSPRTRGCSRRRRRSSRATWPRSVRCCPRVTRASATTTRCRPRSSTCSCASSRRAAPPVPGSPVPASAGASSRSRAASDADDVLARSINRYGAETGLVATGFLATAVDGARP